MLAHTSVIQQELSTCLPMFSTAFELSLLGGPNRTQVKIGLVAFLTMERMAPGLWGRVGSLGCKSGIVQVQEHAALPGLLMGGANDPDSLYPLLTLASVSFLPAKPGDTYEDQTI